MIRLIQVRKNGTALVVKIERRRWVVDAREELPRLHVLCEIRRGQNETKEMRGKRHAKKRKAGNKHTATTCTYYSRNSVNLIRACLGSWPR